MTVIKLNDDENQAAAILARAEAYCNEMFEELDVVRLYWKDKTDLSQAEVRRVMGNFHQSLQTVFNERKRLDEIRKRELGIVHDYAIDFDSVRSEIGGRLARLRAASGAGDVPE